MQDKLREGDGDAVWVGNGEAVGVEVADGFWDGEGVCDEVSEKEKL